MTSSCNLIVNYLPSDLNEEELKSLFSESGRVMSIKIVRNRNTGVSMCYGFVVMETSEEADAAITALNHKEIRGKFLRVSLAKSKEELCKEENNSNLYITGIATDITEAKLESYFQKFGAIISCKIVRNSIPTEKGIAFVKFVKRSDAEKAIKDSDGHPIHEPDCTPGTCPCTEPIHVKFAIPGGKLAAKMAGNPSMPVYVQFSHFPSPFVNPFHAVPTLNIPTKPEISTSLPNYGYAPGYLQTLVAPRIPPPVFSVASQQPNNGYFGFPNYMYPSPTMSSNMANEYVPISGTPGSVNAANIAKLATGQHCIFVYGLSQATTEQELMSLFLPYGAISSCRICYDTSDGKRVCKGFGFVNYYAYNDAQQAISCMNNYSYKGQNLQVRFKSSKDIA